MTTISLSLFGRKQTVHAPEFRFDFFHLSSIPQRSLRAEEITVKRTAIDVKTNEKKYHSLRQLFMPRRETFFNLVCSARIHEHYHHNTVNTWIDFSSQILLFILERSIVMSLSESGWNTYDAPGLNRWQNNANGSTVAKMQHKYWVTKQQVCKKLGKKDDEFIVASDAELDAKLELFKSIRGSCQHLQRIVNKYDEKVYNLAYEENQMGLFLKRSGNKDQTKAGEMMQILGSCMAQSGQERIGLRTPLARLHQEIETFCLRAVEDTQGDVKRMENARTDYRAALNWMKDVSQELDPDTNSQLDKFKNVQTKVKKSKQQFDHHKLICLQKVDLLAAARCNMFSHVLIFYQQSLQRFAESIAVSFEHATKDFKQYQHYDFKMIKELRANSVKSTSKTDDNSNDSSSYTELGIEATCDQIEETNESPLLSLFDGNDSFGNFLSNPYESNQEEKDSELKQYGTGDEFLPSHLLSDLLSGSTAPVNSTSKKSESSSNWADIFADLDPLNDPRLSSKLDPLDLL